MSQAKSAIGLIAQLIEECRLPEGFGEIDSVDADKTSDDLTTIVFNDGSVVSIDLQNNTIIAE